jgi:predicted Zn-dependent protease with MMP-like domain
MADPAYNALRLLYPDLPDIPTPKLTAYANALADKDSNESAHDRRLTAISDALDTFRASIPDTDPEKDTKILARAAQAARDTDDENAAYADMLLRLDAAINKAYDDLPADIKNLLAGNVVQLVADASASQKIADYIKGLDDQTREVLLDLNNQSASTSIDIAVGYIPKSLYLKIPAHLANKIYDLWTTQQTSDTYKNGLSMEEILLVAATNYSCFEKTQGAEFFSLVRAFLCAIIGAPRDVNASKVRFHEVVEVPAVVDKTVLDKITGWMKTQASFVKNLRYFVINFICLTNHVLLSLRSHWKNDASFNAMWANGFKGALLDSVLSQISYDKATLLHDVIHPWGLNILYISHRNFAEHDICDNSMKLRLQGAACGTAAYTGASALIEQMRATKLFDHFMEVRSKEIDSVKLTAAKIKVDRGKYCLNHRYYGENAVPVLPSSDLQAIAPVLMAYRDVFLKNTSFKDIRAIAKVASNSDGVRKVLVEKMKTLVKDAATRVEDLI